MKKNLKKVVSMVLTIAVVFSMATVLVSAEPEQAAETAYTGEEITPDIAAYSAGVQLVNGKDYDLTYENNINVGTATVIVTFKGNYTGTRTTSFNIVARALSGSDVVFSAVDNQTYTGGEIKPKPTITYGDVTLVEDRDYTLTYTDNVNVGTATIHVAFIGNFEGSAETTFEIVPDELSTEDVSFSEIDNQTYTGGELTPEPTITYHGVTLEQGKDYTLSYENNVNAGTATVNVTFTGNYAGSAGTTFEIIAKAADESNITISAIPDQTYTGAAITPEPTVTDTTR
ncbi:hypothetical protein [Ructibacterium gallinarum]|uniref:Uncharacterized protein n=1 Tax=Ructibacterium gallinarum TaxID=2779355 RepID=A0A9D5M733_9FIRM|nr:hypothetical protein [Ructibacterium gallinarum]MBE5040744.1 hypothetical protein [Ructibacterium gallinarum]